jgi:hypothetical protein
VVNLRGGPYYCDGYDRHSYRFVVVAVAVGAVVGVVHALVLAGPSRP